MATQIANDQEQTISDEFRWNLLQKKTLEINAVRAFSLFREQGIEPVLIKGIAAGRFYPEDRPRISIDLDLAVGRDQFDAAQKISRSDAANGLAIDLHNELRHLDTVDWDDLVENSVLMPLEGSDIRVLRPEDHLRVLCVHWLTDGGSNKDRLWDIYYAVTKREPDFDWGRFLNTTSETRRRWLVCTLGLAAKYLGLDLSDTPVADEAGQLPAWLCETVEKEWAAEVKFQPLEVAVHDHRKLFQQIGRRLRPNPIRATVQAEGSFNARTRLHFKIANAVRRIPDSYRRIRHSLANPKRD